MDREPRRILGIYRVENDLLFVYVEDGERKFAVLSLDNPPSEIAGRALPAH